MDNPKPDDDREARAVRHFLAFLAVLVMMVAQIYLFTSPPEQNISLLPASFWIASAITLVALALFVLSQVIHPSRQVVELFGRFSFSRADLWITISVALSLMSVLLMVLLTKYLKTTYIPVVTFWFFAALCYVAAFIKESPSRIEYLEWLKAHDLELVGLGLVTLLGAALRFYQLGSVPRVVNGDEGRVGISALSSITYPYVNPFTLWENFGGLYLQSINVFLNLFGATPFALRLIAAIGGTLAIPALYLLARQIAGRRIALIAASLLAISHTHIHFSRTVAVAYIQGTWLIPLELYFLLSGLEKRSSWRTALAGVLLAIHFSVYLDSQLTAVLVLVFMAIAFLFLRPWFRPALSQAEVFWSGFAIIILPHAVFSWNQPSAFFDRLNVNGTFQSGWLAQEVADTGHSAVQVLGERVIHAFLSLIYYPSFDFYGSPLPTLTLVTALLFLLGLGIALWKTRAPGFLLLNGYFWAGTLSIGLFAIPPSADTYRMLIVLPAALLLAAIGLDGTLTALGFGWDSTRRTYLAVSALTISSILIFNVWTYYFDFAGRCLYGIDSPPARFASYMGNYVHTIDKESVVYLLSDATYVYGSHPSVDFLSGSHPITNVDQSGETLPVRPDETIIASPDRIAELKGWSEVHPGGTLHYEYDCQQTILLAYRFP